LGIILIIKNDAVKKNPRKVAKGQRAQRRKFTFSFAPFSYLAIFA
jgi:hypothetical protein